MADEKAFTWLLNGKLRTADDGVLVGEGDFKELTNLRYGDQNPKGILGMTKINAAATSYTDLKNGFHFRKDRVAEDHLLVQTTEATDSRLVKSDTASNVPSADTFTNWLTLDNNNRVNFSKAPDNSMLFCNGEKNYVWGGDKARTPKFITSSAAVTTSITNPVDYTEVINNELTDNENVAILGGGDDATAVLLIHANEADATAGTDIIDSGATTHTITATGNAQVDTAQAKFGTGSVLFDGTGDYLSIADHADWNMGTGTLTIDFWVRFSALSGQHCLYSQATTTSHVTLYYDNTAQKLILSVMSAGTRVIHESGTWAPSASTWYHVAVVRGWGGVANAWAITVDGTAITTFTNAGTMPDIGAVLWIGMHPTAVVLDSGNTGHGFTATNNAALTAAQYKFANGSITLPAVTDYISAADHADFNFAAADFTVECFVRVATYPGAGESSHLARQWQTANQYGWVLYIYNDGGTKKLRFGYTTDGTAGTLTTISQTMSASATNAWYHVAVKRNGNALSLWQDGVQLGTDSDVTGVTIHNSTAAFIVGAGDGGGAVFVDEMRISNTARTITVPTTPYTSDSNTKLLLHCNYIALNGWVDEYRVSKGIARWTAAFTPFVRAYSTAALTWLVASIRPLQGVYLYLQDVNSIANTLTVKEWNGYSWNSLTVTDGTRNVGDTASLTKNGAMTWTSTESTSKPRMLNEIFGYWYQFTLTAGNATIYQATTNMAPQPIVDIWDGALRSCYAFFKFTTAYTDLTVNIADSDYSSSTTYSYANIGGLAAFSTPNNCVFAGFTERLCGLHFVLPDDTKVNVTAATTMAIDAWDGYAWLNVGTISDGTSSGAISLNQTGTVTWQPREDNTEFKTTIGNGSEYYYYRIRWDKEVDNTGAGNDVRIDSITGIPVQKTLNAYRYPVSWQNRTWLLDEVKGQRNAAICSSSGTTCVFNGTDSVKFQIGGAEQLMAAASLYTRYGGATYENLIVCKRNSTHLIDGTTVADYRIIDISDTDGCISPLTMRKCDLGYEVAPGVSKHVVIWLSASGVMMYDGSVLSNISRDIQDRFQSWQTNYINNDLVANFFGDYDPVNKEYHLMIATGSSTVLNEEWVYDIVRRKWYLIDRGATKRLACMWNVTDSYGNTYNYGGTEDGYIERLEYGTDFDGTDITHTLTTGDIPLSGTPLVETEMKYLRLAAKSKTVTYNTIALTHYANTQTTGTSLTAIAMYGYDTRGSDLVTNGGFATATTGWTANASCSIAVTSAYLTMTRVSGTTQYCYQTITGLTVGKTYRVSAYVKSGTSGNETFYLYIDDGASFSETGTTSATWTKYDLSFVATATSHAIRLVKGSATAGTMLFDTVTMYEATPAQRVFIKEIPVALRGYWHGIKMVVITDDESVGFEPFLLSGTVVPTKQSHY